MGDGEGYEFIYLARCETGIAQKSAGIEGYGGRRRQLPALTPDLKTAEM